ncbi:MAG: PEP-CTERM sorting domain-containing protein [Rubritalea sp.]|tara:strand:- start:28131 stop:28904 length:774 start_codon:yes stop_codon:yes gene_type:complete
MKTNNMKTTPASKSKFLATTLALTAGLLIGSANAATIAVDDIGTFFHPYSNVPSDRKWTLDSTALGGFDASGSDKLVLTFGGENQTSGYDEISFGGVAMTRIVFAEPGGQDVSIWYLDNPGTGNLVVDLKAGNGIGLSVLALSNTADGFATTANAAGVSTSINTTGLNSFVVAAGERNNQSSLVAEGDLTQVYSGDAGSSSHGSAYQQVATSGTTITPTFTSAEGVVAVEFLSVVPEPSTTALIGLGGLALILRRRK